MENPFFKEGDQLAYVVWYDNMEPYDDHYIEIDAIFSSWEEAERYINDRYGDYKNFKRERVKDYIYPWGFSKTLIISCIDWRFEDDTTFDKPRMTIEIWNLTTGQRVYYDNEHIFLEKEK